MLDFWSARAREYATDLRANTADVWLREVEIRYVEETISARGPTTVLDFGCANGYSTLRLARSYPTVDFLGIDLNEEMIAAASAAAERAGPPNVRFERRDILAEGLDDEFSMVLSVRAIQNVTGLDTQKAVFEALAGACEQGGLMLLIESYLEGYERLNRDRVALGLAPLPIHEHLTLLTPTFDAHARALMRPVADEHLSSSYYLVTRLVYSFLAMEAGEAIDYDHPLHRVAAHIPQIGDYGPQRATTYEKR